MGPGVDAAFARSVARWLRAYPRRWRAARADEITAVLADLAPPGARRLDLRSGLGLLVAGWRTRWREHPPLLAYLGYVALELRLDPRYRDWARDDIEGTWFVVRRWVVAFAVVGAIASTPVLGGSTPLLGLLRGWAPVMLLGIAIWGGHWRARMVARQLVVQPGETVTPSGRIPGIVARPRVEARSWIAAARVVAVTVLALCVVTLAVAPYRTSAVREGAELQITSTPMTAGARGLGLGLAVLGVLVGLAVRRRAGARVRAWRPVAQPHRWVVPLGPAGRSRLAAAVGAGALLTLWAPGLAALLAGLVAALAAAALPVLAAAGRALDQGRTGVVAGIDLVRALRRRPDRADAPVDGYLPAADWLPVGTVVPLPGDPAPAARAPGTALDRRG
ncbi:hypothetical protein [Cellulomonas sp. PS-H5]|uniref:hypothetical protein n=1 Tax=Cellulomonas sp. PS-H5 TaxID=2820400 RepID=UPI001C4FD89B|nr:hypothetical protein [Cellulomonas sp. PS-H5]MBW0253975.1 hypothetical protein [Cellulomonas sp. PS-H5]